MSSEYLRIDGTRTGYYRVDAGLAFVDLTSADFRDLASDTDDVMPAGLVFTSLTCEATGADALFVGFGPENGRTSGARVRGNSTKTFNMRGQAGADLAPITTVCILGGAAATTLELTATFTPAGLA